MNGGYLSSSLSYNLHIMYMISIFNYQIHAITMFQFLCANRCSLGKNLENDAHMTCAITQKGLEKEAYNLTNEYFVYQVQSV